MAWFSAPALPNRRRAFAFGLAVLLEILFIAALLLLGGYRPDSIPRTTAAALIDVAPEAKPKAAIAVAQAERGTPPTPRKARVEATTPPVAMPPTAPGYVVLSPADYAASDIGKLPDRRGGSAAGEQSAERQGNGEAPGGGNLYNAEWVREPTDAELALYLPKRRGTGWAMVACRTAPRNRVEDCRHLGESPGSGLASTLRQASWQFLVRPPRLDGKPIVGAWVRIRFDFTVRSSTEEG